MIMKAFKNTHINNSVLDADEQLLFNDDDDDSDAARATDDEDSNGEYDERYAK